MNLNEVLLPKLADWHLPGGERQTLHVADTDNRWRVSVSADRNDVLGCLVWEVALQRLQAAETTSLKAWAERAASEVTGLLEPLKVVEVDPIKNQALLRSATPIRRGTGLSYFEVLLTGVDTALLRRYQAPSAESKHRQQVLFPLTHETLGKVASDLTQGV